MVIQDNLVTQQAVRSLGEIGRQFVRVRPRRTWRERRLARFAQRPFSSARQTRTVTGCCRAMWSVVRVGIVQAKRTELPIRTAERFKTGVGSLRLGGCGAAGAPHPIVEPATRIASSAVAS
jgi:hypothetical protein